MRARLNNLQGAWVWAFAICVGLATTSIAYAQARARAAISQGPKMVSEGRALRPGGD